MEVAQETPVVTLTDSAAAKLSHLLQERGLEGYGLRVFVQGGGCAGLQYGMAFDKQALEGDSIVEVNGTRVYVDRISAQYLRGSTIDYVENLMGGGFRIDNPNVAPLCGRGCNACG